MLLLSLTAIRNLQGSVQLLQLLNALLYILLSLQLRLHLLHLTLQQAYPWINCLLMVDRLAGHQLIRQLPPPPGGGEGRGMYHAADCRALGCLKHHSVLSRYDVVACPAANTSMG